MRPRIIVGVFLLIALVGGGTLAAYGSSGISGNYVGPDQQWTITTFFNPVWVKGQVVWGPVLIVHDSAKMARGEACTTFYRFDPAKGLTKEIVSFHCNPRQAESVATTTFTTGSTVGGCKRLVDFQIAGDSEGHGIPIQ